MAVQWYAHAPYNAADCEIIIYAQFQLAIKRV